MPTRFSHIDLFLVTLPFALLQLLQNCYCYFCHHYRYFHTTLLLNTLLQILSCPGVVELTTQLLILENILWLPLCRINKFGLNTLPSKAVAIPYTCGLSPAHLASYQRTTDISISSGASASSSAPPNSSTGPTLLKTKATTGRGSRPSPHKKQVAFQVPSEDDEADDEELAEIIRDMQHG